MIDVEELKLRLISFLLGEIYPNTIAVTFILNLKEKKLTLKYYLDKQCTHQDHDVVEGVLALLLASFDAKDYEQVSNTEAKCIFVQDKVSNFFEAEEEKLIFYRNNQWPKTPSELY